MSSKGRLFVISASSGTGKTTLAKELLKKDRKLVQSISYTTRKPRHNEQQGIDYFFVSKKEFKAIKRKRGFLEWANVFGRFYGTPKKEVEQHLKKKRDVLLLRLLRTPPQPRPKRERPKLKRPRKSVKGKG